MTVHEIRIDRSKTLVDEPDTGHNRWHPDIPPVVRCDVGDEVVLETRDAFDGQMSPDATLETIGVPYLLASALAFALGALNSYVLNRRWTFRSRGRRGPELLRFAVVQCIGLGLDVVLLAVLTEDVRIHHLIACRTRLHA